MTLFPDGYRTDMVSLDQMVARYRAKMHPEFARRFFAYMEYKGGLLGVGQAWRPTQPPRPGFAPDGQSFHQDQRFEPSGFVGCAAVDLVTTDGPDANNTHDTITWAMTADAPAWGLHTFIRAPIEEPWHIQCIEHRGWAAWVLRGRPDPDPNFVLPGQGFPPPKPLPEPDPDPIVPPEGAPEMFIVEVTNAPTSPVPKTWILAGPGTLTHMIDGFTGTLFVSAKVPVVPLDPKTGASQLSSLIKQSVTTNDCPEEWEMTGWEVLWNQSKQ